MLFTVERSTTEHACMWVLVRAKNAVLRNKEEIPEAESKEFLDDIELVGRVMFGSDWISRIEQWVVPSPDRHAVSLSAARNLAGPAFAEYYQYLFGELASGLSIEEKESLSGVLCSLSAINDGVKLFSAEGALAGDFFEPHPDSDVDHLAVQLVDLAIDCARFRKENDLLKSKTEGTA
jgi:hypothetical protein